MPYFRLKASVNVLSVHSKQTFLQVNSLRFKKKKLNITTTKNHILGFGNIFVLTTFTCCAKLIRLLAKW